MTGSAGEETGSAPTGGEDASRSESAGSTSVPQRVGLTATLELWYSGAPSAAAAARRVVGSLDDHFDVTRLDDVLLLVTELVTNAIRHAGVDEEGSVGLDVSVTPGVLRVEVSDPGPGFEQLEHPEPDLDRTGGWGLFLVDQLADRWGVKHEVGTRVWFEMDHEPPGG